MLHSIISYSLIAGEGLLLLSFLYRRFIRWGLGGIDIILIFGFITQGIAILIIR